MLVEDASGISHPARGRLTREFIPWGPAKPWDFLPLLGQLLLFRVLAVLSWAAALGLFVALTAPFLLPARRAEERESLPGAFYLVMLVFGLSGVWLWKRGAPAVRAARRVRLCGLHRRCAACLYDLSGVATAPDGYARCPECSAFWTLRRTAAPAVKPPEPPNPPRV